VDSLISFGVDTIFGMPGDGINAGTPGAEQIRNRLERESPQFMLQE